MLFYHRSKRPRYSVRNETPKRLILRGNNNRILTLAPLETTEPLGEANIAAFDFRILQYQNMIRIVESDVTSTRETLVSFVIGAAFLWAIVGAILTPWIFLAGHRWEWYWGIGIAMLAVILLAARVPGTVLLRRVVQTSALTMVLMMGIGLPTVIVAVSFLRYSSPDAKFDYDVLTPATLKLLFIAIASVLPGLMYFLFDRQRLTTTRDRFAQAIFRLDLTVLTLTDVRAKYGRQMEEVFGPEGRLDRVRLVPGSRIPILVATLIITLGWIVTLGLTNEVKNPTEMFQPQQSAIAFGFLGSYFFGLQDILRRYVRGDLQPKAYTSIAVRILVVTIIGWVLYTLPLFSAKFVCIFLAGIVPETWITFFREYARKKIGGKLNIPEEQFPLTDLDGVDLYDRARLMDEGVTNIESLAHHDFLDLVMSTRIPVPRLVDWVDQSILYLHISARSPLDKKKAEASELFKRLRVRGIRTATDLLQAYSIAQARGDKDRLLTALSGTQETGSANPVQNIIDALQDDEWLSFVLTWREKIYPLYPEQDAFDIPAVSEIARAAAAAA